MNLPKSPLRRIAAIAAGALIGLTGVGVMASPASAHHPEPSGTYCLASDGRVTVNWKVGNTENIFATITAVTSTVPSEFSGGDLKVGATLPAKGGDLLTATQTHRFTGRIPKIELTVEARWVRPNTIVTEHRTARATRTGTCAPQPTTSPSSPTPTAPVSPTPTAPVSPTPTAPASPTPTASPTPSQPVTGSPTPTTTPAPVAPVGTVESNCDALKFTIENPADGETVTLTLTPNKGAAKTLIVEPGKTGSVSFEATEGLIVTPTAEGLDDTSPIAWEKPADCNPGQGGGDKDEPALPLTGAATGGIIAGAVVLLAAGAGLFVMARRRKVRFTA